jgi:Bacteriophage protein gp37
MAENSGIEWTTHTFNPWTGCTKVSPACDNCYAEGWAKRSGHVEWGPRGARRRTKTWRDPIKWNKQAEGAAERPRVFCASLADVFDNHKSIEQAWRRELWDLIDQTPNLDWLLLTKRPQNIVKFSPERWFTRGIPSNVWLGTTVENQEEADRRIPHLIQCPARVLFLSCEPLLGPLSIRRYVHKLDWIITGGESGPRARPSNPQWFRDLRDQCSAADVPFLFKQWGEWVSVSEVEGPGIIFTFRDGRNVRRIGTKRAGRTLDGVVHDGYPEVLV